jgi:hypothetical protein
VAGFTFSALGETLSSMIGPRLIIASAACWCAAGITTGVVQRSHEIAQEAAAESPEPVITEILAKGDRLPLAPMQSISDRWYTPPPVERSQELLVDEPIGNSPTSPLHLPSAHRADRHSDVCTRHGMHRVVTRGGRSWRCKR